MVKTAHPTAVTAMALSSGRECGSETVTNERYVGGKAVRY
jgi:hypothetical protein